MIDEMMPHPYQRSRMADNDPIDPSTWETPVLSDVSGYIRFIDTGRLVALAKSYRVKVQRSPPRRPVRSGRHPAPDGVQRRAPVLAGNRRAARRV